MSTLSQFAAGGIKSVQRGTFTIGTGSLSGIATISSVDVNKSFISYLGQTTDSADARFYETRIRLASSTTVSATRHFTGSTVIVSYEVIEFY